MPWNVPDQGRSAAPRAPPDWWQIRRARRVISAAARRVNVSSKIRRGSAPFPIRWATRCASVWVFPDPAPAMIRSGGGAAFSAAGPIP